MQRDSHGALAILSGISGGKYGIAWMWEGKRCCDLAEKEAAIFRGCELAAADMLSYLDAATATRLEL